MTIFPVNGLAGPFDRLCASQHLLVQIPVLVPTCLGPVLLAGPIAVKVVVRFQLRFQLGHRIVFSSGWVTLTLPFPASVLVPARLRYREGTPRMHETLIFLWFYKVPERKKGCCRNGP